MRWRHVAQVAQVTSRRTEQRVSNYWPDNASLQTTNWNRTNEKHEQQDIKWEPFMSNLKKQGRRCLWLDCNLPQEGSWALTCPSLYTACFFLNVRMWCFSAESKVVLLVGQQNQLEDTTLEIIIFKISCVASATCHLCSFCCYKSPFSQPRCAEIVNIERSKQIWAFHWRPFWQPCLTDWSGKEAYLLCPD